MGQVSGFWHRLTLPVKEAPGRFAGVSAGIFAEGSDQALRRQRRGSRATSTRINSSFPFLATFPVRRSSCFDRIRISPFRPSPGLWEATSARVHCLGFLVRRCLRQWPRLAAAKESVCGQLGTMPFTQPPPLAFPWSIAQALARSQKHLHTFVLSLHTPQSPYLAQKGL